MNSLEGQRKVHIPKAGTPTSMPGDRGTCRITHSREAMLGDDVYVVARVHEPPQTRHSRLRHLFPGVTIIE